MQISPSLRAELKAAAQARLMRMDAWERRTLLLVNNLEASFGLDEGQRAEFKALMDTPAYAEAKKLLSDSFQKMFDQGFEEGIERALTEKREFIAMLLEKRFGPLPAAARDRLKVMTADELTDLGLRLLDAASLADLHLTD
jgi:hypothetical protein